MLIPPTYEQGLLPVILNKMHSHERLTFLMLNVFSVLLYVHTLSGERIDNIT
jgi:hypothetical protein